MNSHTPDQPASNSPQPPPGVVCSDGLGRTNPATKWFDGEISTGKMLQICNVPKMQGLELVGGIWQAMREKVYDLDAELERKIKVANDFKGLAESGDMERTTKYDVIAERIRATALQEARTLLRFHLLGCIDRTVAGVP